MKTRILYISSSTGIGGQEIVVKRLLETLDKTRYQVDVLITHFHGPLQGDYEKHSNAVFFFDNRPGINIGNTIFQFQFTTPGVVPYFCRPHEVLNMKGVITVDSTTPVEPTTWGRIKRIFESAGR